LNLAEQLTRIYHESETWHKIKLDEESSNEYHRKLLEQGNIITITKGDLLVGYVEFWRISYEQFGRIICGEPFSALCEDVVHGNIAYVANTFILPEYRKGKVYKMLRDRFLETNKMCTHFCGTARRKKSEPVKVFRNKDIFK
jgi:hypothetical protein